MKLLSPAIIIAVVFGVAAIAIPPPAKAGLLSVYDTSPSPRPPGVLSLSFGANGILEAGKLIEFSGTSPVRIIEGTVIFANYSYQSAFPSFSGDEFLATANFLQFNFYNVNADDSVGTKIAEVSSEGTFAFQWRGEPGSFTCNYVDPTGCTGTPCQTAAAYRADDGKCYLNSASVTGINFSQALNSAGLDLPSRVIFSVSMNTVLDGQGHRIIDPQPGPWQGVNLGYTDSLPSVGTNPTQGISYLDLGAGFQAYSDSGLEGYSPMVNFRGEQAGAATPEPASLSMGFGAFAILLLTAKRSRSRA